MLITAKTIRDISIGGLMGLYEQSNRDLGSQRWPGEPLPRQMALAEQEAYEDLRAFFWQSGAEVFVWQEEGVYLAALRLEPYREGRLLTCLETAPAHRRRGYGTILLAAVLHLQAQPVYSHIAADNAPSIRLHEKCGFQKISDTAILLDGSASSRMGTYLFTP